MALKKSKTLPTGVTGEYWRIIQNNTHHDRDGVIDLALYVDADTRQTAQPLDGYQIDLGQHWLDTEIPAGVVSVRAALLKLAYIVFKAMAQAEAEKPADERDAALAWFADAEDV